MLAFGLVLCINKSPSVVVGRLCLWRLGSAAKACDRYSKERLSCEKQPHKSSVQVAYWDSELDFISR